MPGCAGLPQARCRASLLFPTGGPSTSYCCHRLAAPSARQGTSVSIAETLTRNHTSRRPLQVHAEYERQPDPRWRGPPTQTYDDRDLRRGQYDYPPQNSRYKQPPPPPEPPTETAGAGPGGGGGGGPDSLTKALIGGAFVLGIGVGVWFNSEATFYPSNVASTEIIDRKTPNTEVCMANGYSSMVFDQRLFVSFNPFNVYVAQPEVKPGCVLRRSNISVLESRKLVTDKDVNQCVRNANTFAFVGDLSKSPEVSCVYHSEEAENQFIRNPKRAAMGDGVQPLV